jgi:hypothetical protein
LAIIKDMAEERKNQGFEVRAFEIQNQAITVLSDGRVTLHLQLKRAPAPLNKVSSPPMPSTSLGGTLALDRYRNVTITGGAELKPKWEAWCALWDAVPKPASSSDANLRRVFPDRDTYAAHGDVLRDLLADELKKTADKIKSGLIDITASEVDALIEALMEVERGWLAGESSPLLHCMFCRTGIVLLDFRPIPRWCCARTGQPHEHCSEQRLWAGEAGAVEEGEEETDEEADE